MLSQSHRFPQREYIYLLFHGRISIRRLLLHFMGRKRVVVKILSSHHHTHRDSISHTLTGHPRGDIRDGEILALDSEDSLRLSSKEHAGHSISPPLFQLFRSSIDFSISHMYKLRKTLFFSQVSALARRNGFRRPPSATEDQLKRRRRRRSAWWRLWLWRSLA